MSILLITFFCTKVNGQYNLVLNASFEQYTICPSTSNPLTLINWHSASFKRAGIYFNGCSSTAGFPNNNNGYQYPRTGNGGVALFYFNGINQNKRNYIQTQLIDSLKRNKYYYVEYFVSLGDYNRIGCNNISLLLTDTAAQVDTLHFPAGVLPANAQVFGYGNPIITDTMNWVKIAAIYKAHGGEQYLTLGNFKYDNQTNYAVIQPTGYNGAGYYIDDVSVIPLDSFCLKADAGRDTAINAGDSVFIGSYTNGIDTVRWLNGSTVIDSTRPGFWVKPTVTTTYILHQIVNGCYSSDTVTVNVTIVPLTITSFSAFATPLSNGEGQGVRLKWQTMTEINVSHYNVQRSTNGKDFITVGKVKANNKVLNEYQYSDDRLPLTIDGQLYYRIVGVDNDGKMTYSEVRSISPPVGGVGGGFTVFPNPCSDFINITGKQIQQVKITDVLGKVVWQQNYNNDNFITFAINSFKTGLYIVQIAQKDGSLITQKLIKQ